jgi:glycerate kinase
VRVLICPDSFGGTLSAPDVAEALAAGWQAARPDDELAQLPLSDGGPGLLDVLEAALPGSRLHARAVQDPLGRPVSGHWLRHGDTAYIESAQACGLHLLAEPERDPGRTTTYGVGELIRGALDAGARRVMVGLGGSGTNDGGAGLLASLGLTGYDAAGARLPPGGLALAEIALLGTLDPLGTEAALDTLDPLGTEAALDTLDPLGTEGADVELVAATDVDAPLLGPYGASAVFGPQKGASPAQVQALDAALACWADVVEQHLGVSARELPGAGAAGGLGFALLALGAHRRAGFDVVADAVGLTARIAAVDLVITGEGSFDASSLTGKVVSGVAARAAGQCMPCVVLAGQVSVGADQATNAGVGAAYSLAAAVGLERALAEPYAGLVLLAGRVAGQWPQP